MNVELLRQGNADEIKQCILDHVNLAKYLSRRICKKHHRDDAQSVAFVALVEAVDRISKGKVLHNNITGYISRSISGRLLNFLHKKEELNTEFDPPVDSDTSFIVVDFINMIPHEGYKILVAKRLEGYADYEIAAMLGISPAAMSNLSDELRGYYGYSRMDGRVSIITRKSARGR